MLCMWVLPIRSGRLPRRLILGMWVLSLGVGLLPRRLILGLGTCEPGKSVGLGDGREGGKKLTRGKKASGAF